MSILMREYDYETDIRVKQQDAYEDGLEEGISVGLERGLEQGAYQNKLETAKILLSMGLSPLQVAQATNLPLETIQEFFPYLFTQQHYL